MTSNAKKRTFIGTFGEIKKLMKTLSKRDLHTDMEFVCGAEKNILKCHRFIIGAQVRVETNLVNQHLPI